MAGAQQRMPIGLARSALFWYTVRRVANFLLVVWAAASLNFFLPRLSGRDPIRERLGALAATGAATRDIDAVVQGYREKFGLDQPLLLQYFRYLGDVATLDFGYSLANFPARVTDLIASALPWTIGLLLVSTLISFVVGSLAGALLAWPRAPKFTQYLFTPFLTLSAIPYYLLGLVMIYFLAFKSSLFPLSAGGYAIGSQPELSLSFVLDMLHHSLLPALSIVLSQIGFWALSMRGMMVMVEGEDYMGFAEAKGLSARTIFLRYGMRNALLPQTTSLALSLGTIASGSILVEVVFAYPGVGSLLYRAVTGFDYFLIYGIVFLVVVTIGLATLILDLVYPLLDPRITYQQR